MDIKDCSFELKEVAEDGTFEGLLSVYGNIDHTGDIVEPGAFTRTIADNNGTVPMLWQHDRKEPIGLLELTDTAKGLQVKGIFDLNVQRAKEAYSLAKKRIVKGLSIGYDTVAATAVAGKARKLTELKLWEGSVVTFPANSLALITAVKDGDEKALDFLAALDRERLYSIRYQMMSALRDALDSIVWDRDMKTEDKPGAAGKTIDQFKTAFTAVLPEVLKAMDEMYKSTEPADIKAGRVLSAASRKKLEDTVGLHDEMMGIHGKAKAILQGMLDAETDDETKQCDALAQVKTQLVLAITA